ncbi:MAG: GNAT family N-acetyltransferase [Maribacter sp.]|nr:GNAT family N-acetyltransferase [Maribacter sp.]
MNSVDIRRSFPEDAEMAVPFIYSSGPTAFDYVFKTKRFSAQDFLRFAFVRKGGEFSYQNHYSVLVNNQLVGAGAVFTGDEILGFTMSNAKRIIQFYGINSTSIIPRGLKIESLIRPPRKPEVAIGHLGIRESFRGQGLGTMLMEKLMESPKINGHTSFILDVSVDNPNAQKLYERMGFTITKKCLSTLNNKYAQVVDHNRMSRNIL